MELKNVFVTVGTTKFKKLIDKIQDQTIVQILKKLNCNQLTIQTGAYNLESFDNDLFESIAIKIKIYDYADSLNEDMSNADLIIGHAGAGTCLEGLRLNKRMIIVINEDLMDNHQTELAFKLSDENYAEHCTIETLDDALNNLQNRQFKPFPKHNPSILSNFIDNLFKDLIE